MQHKLLVALRFKVPQRFIERPAGRRARGVKDPGALGATPTPQTLLFNPYQLPTHGCPCRCAHRGLTPLVLRLPNLGGGKRCAKKLAKFTCANLHGLFGILHTQTSFGRAEAPSQNLLCSSSGEANVGYPTEASCLRGALYTLPAVTR